ncbi:MAG: OmpA family protein [Bacteroidota bacterium]
MIKWSFRFGELLFALTLNFLLGSAVFCQNLVPNPGFEDFIKCPGVFHQSAREFSIPQWMSANTGTPDHFHSCSRGEADVPYNWAGVSDAYEGHGYAGIYAWNGLKEYREFIQCKLREPLTKDTVYQIAFRFKLSSYSKFSIDRMGLLLSDSLLTWGHDHAVDVEPTLAVVRDSALTAQTGQWEKASMDYKAHGGERFLTVGNFYNDAVTKTYDIRFRPASEEMLAQSAYYYIDQVEVTPKFQPITEVVAQLRPAFEPEQVALNTTYALKNIQYEFDSYKLLPGSFEELDRLASFLAMHPKLKVQLSGHTDDQGSDNYNLKLSRKRANSAAAYLISLGIDKDRIEIFGYGKTRFITDNRSEAARAINRRVEVRFIE